jgi:integrase
VSRNGNGKARNTVKTVGRVVVFRHQGAYRLRWRDVTGRRNSCKGERSLTGSIALARKINKAARAGATGPDAERREGRRLAPLVMEYASVLTRNAEEKHQRNVCGAIRRVFRSIKAVRISDVTVEKVDRFLDRLAGDGRAVGTVNHYIGYLRQFFRWLEDADRIDKSPLRALRPRPGDPVRRRQADTPEEIAKVLEAATRGKPYEYWAYLLCYGAGLRQNEVLNLRWGDVDLKAGLYKLIGARQKSGKDTVTALQPIVIEELTRLWELRKAECGHPPPDEECVVHNAPKAARTLATDRRLTVERAGLRYKDLNGAVNDWHAMRHSFCTNLSATVKDMREKQSLMRHADIKTTSLYDHTDLEKQKAVLRGVDFIAVHKPEGC